MTGSEFSQYFDNKTDKSYSAFLNNTKKNALFKEALFVSIEDKYRQMGEQRDYDALLPSLKTNKVFKLNNNKIHVEPVQIVSIAPAGLTIFVLTKIPHNLITGDIAVLFDVAGITTTPAINGTDFTVTRIDDLNFSFTVSVVGGAYTPNTGRIIDHKLGGYQKMISDYLHILSVKTKFTQQVVSNYKKLQVTKASNTQPIVLTLSTKNNNVKTPEQITVSGVGGNTNANGIFYIKRLNSNSIALYYDKELTNAASGNGDYIGGGFISRVFYDYADVLFPTMKVSKYDFADVTDSKYERGDMFLKFYPDDVVCDEITADYLSAGLQFIDANDTAINLESYYPYEFLMYILDKSIKIYAATFIATELYQTASLSEAQNK